ncbi:gamma-glutamylcyclotransferase family protein [Lacimicrobium alkaliphilum]|uniref:Gamma-glutamylcyclotransferase n=1 Tax=Lacimicrobium alkaliphilum TaxID=1526571 RepID=A0ABQ1R6A4_9ALTE|nr:gamma-glutamylcyclotransferase family protein [Lacimicrobium alkaliphilum]GGD59781.1 gamma-glutamylcyclotransferase [Lacimicrobium alkaliphilum]
MQDDAGKCLYFAYGSNMSWQRVGARISPIQRVGVAQLYGFALKFHKVGKDGSAKCNAWCTGEERDTLWGVLYELSADQLETLDQLEGTGQGYQRRTVAVYYEQQRIETQIYVATEIDDDLQPFDWYLEHVLSGARQNNLPAEHQNLIVQTPIIEDSDRARFAREMSIYDNL